jgi:hypothetical protein
MQHGGIGVFILDYYDLLPSAKRNLLFEITTLSVQRLK